jgi:CRISPR-associated endonuclease/helicase Cas3
MENQPSYLTYWGKAAGNDSSQFHLLVHHCLDVAAVAAVWWELSPRIRHLFCHQSKLSQEQIRAWILFFIALHDIGKFDLRFQRKVKNIWRHLQKPSVATRLSPKDSQKYFHGPAGLYWLKHEFDEIIFAKNKHRAWSQLRSSMTCPNMFKNTYAGDIKSTLRIKLSL